MSDPQDVYDYGQAMSVFFEQLAKLREHIADHQMFEGWEEVVEEIKHAEVLHERYGDEYPSEEAMATWTELFDYMRDNM